jgi:hypothetical protein
MDPVIAVDGVVASKNDGRDRRANGKTVVVGLNRMEIGAEEV